MSLQFLNLHQILVKMGVKRIGSPYGSYAVYPTPSFAKDLRKKRFWIALNERDELVCSKNMLDCGNSWLDDLIRMKDNQPDKFKELITC